jgi:hypothetical protein
MTIRLLMMVRALKANLELLSKDHTVFFLAKPAGGSWLETL